MRRLAIVFIAACSTSAPLESGRSGDSAARPGPVPEAPAESAPDASAPGPTRDAGPAIFACSKTGYSAMFPRRLFVEGDAFWVWNDAHYVEHQGPSGAGGIIAGEVWWPVLLASPTDVWWASNTPYRTERRPPGGWWTPVPGPQGLRPLAGNLAFGALYTDLLDVHVVQNSELEATPRGRLPAGPAFTAEGAEGRDVPPAAAMDGDVIAWSSGSSVYATALSNGVTKLVATAPAASVAISGDVVAFVAGGRLHVREGAAGVRDLAPAPSARVLAFHGGRVVVASETGLTAVGLDGDARPFATQAGDIASAATSGGNLYAMGRDGEIWMCH